MQIIKDIVIAEIKVLLYFYFSYDKIHMGKKKKGQIL